MAEKNLKETSLFTIAINSIKYLRVTLTKQVEDLHDKYFQSLKKENEETLENGKISHALG